MPGLHAVLGTLAKGQPGRVRLFLTDLLLTPRLTLSGLLTVSFHALAGRTICKIIVEAASAQVRVSASGSEWFFMQTGDNMRELSPSETHGYVRQHWAV